LSLSGLLFYRNEQNSIQFQALIFILICRSLAKTQNATYAFNVLKELDNPVNLQKRVSLLKYTEVVEEYSFKTDIEDSQFRADIEGSIFTAGVEDYLQRKQR